MNTTFYTPPEHLRGIFTTRQQEVVVDTHASTSLAVLHKLNVLALKYPGMRGLVLGHGGFRVTVLRTLFQEEVNRAAAFDDATQRIIFPTRSAVTFADAADVKKFITGEFDTLYIHDAGLLGLEGYDMILPRLRHGVVPYQQAFVGHNGWLDERIARGHAVRI